jgi:hypothetical protein
MTVLLYSRACVAGLALGWFAYDIAKAACMAVIERRRGGFLTASVKHGSRLPLRHPHRWQKGFHFRPRHGRARIGPAFPKRYDRRV